MKWNSTLGFIGTSENLMLLDSAPMYSLNIRFVLEESLVAPTWVDEMNNNNMKNVLIMMGSSIVVQLRKLRGCYYGAI